MYTVPIFRGWTLCMCGEVGLGGGERGTLCAVLLENWESVTTMEEFMLLQYRPPPSAVAEFSANRELPTWPFGHLYPRSFVSPS